MSPAETFLSHLTASLAEGTFVKCTLSAPEGGEPTLRNLYIRPVELKEGPHLAATWRYATRDIAKNWPRSEGAVEIQRLLRQPFFRADLFTTTGDWRLYLDATGPGKLKRSRATFAAAEPAEHNRPKQRAVAVQQAPFLRALGVTNERGEARPGMVGKLRQVERFTELLHPLLAALPQPAGLPLRVLDMGAGKGYLTFALAELLRQAGRPAEVIGVEQRGDLVTLTNRLAGELGYRELRFVEGAIGRYQPEPTDVLIALHACNTATDDALFAGLRAGAGLMVVAPCCHQELRPQMQTPPGREAILRHGILKEREAESLTDALRALLLEMEGFRTQVFEFIGSEHTGKNVMLTAERRAQPVSAAKLQAQWDALGAAYGLRSQRLGQLLGRTWSPAAPARPGFQVAAESA